MQYRFLLSFILLQFIFLSSAYAQVINTIAGGGGDRGQATSATMSPISIATDKWGNLLIADATNLQVRKVSPGGIVSTIAGKEPGYSSYTFVEGGAAISAYIEPTAVAADTFGNVFIIDAKRNTIRKINEAGIISTFIYDTWRSWLSATSSICTDQTGNVYIGDYNIIRKVDRSGTLTTLAGNGMSGFSADGTLATNAMLNPVAGICTDIIGNLYFTDNIANRVRKINAAGILSTIAGNGSAGYSGDGASATDAQLNSPSSVYADNLGNIFIADKNNNIIRRVDNAGIITTVIGTFSSGAFSGDGGPATLAKLNAPGQITGDGISNVFVTELNSNRVRSVNAAGIINTAAGNGYPKSAGYYGDGGSAISALFNEPRGIALDTLQNLYIADGQNKVIRKINTAGIITTICGPGISGQDGLGGPATAAQIGSPTAISTDRAGNLYISSSTFVKRIDNSGVISAYAGRSSSFGSLTYGHRADSVYIGNISAIATDRTGNLYISSPARLFRVDTARILTVVAGTGIAGYFGDGGAATAAQITPTCIYCDDQGNIYIGENSRVRKINAGGVITTIAGTGSYTSATGDGGPAINASILIPNAITSDKNNNLLIYTASTIRKIDASGIITTVAGNGIKSYSGDGTLATTAGIDGETYAGMVVDTSGNIILTNSYNNCIRKIYTPTLTITASDDTVCTGTAITFTAMPTGMAGYTPRYQWKKNGINVGTNSLSYTEPAPVNGDKFSCSAITGGDELTIGASNSIDIVVNGLITPSVSFAYSPTLICPGTIVTCTVTSTNSGTAPVYNWYKNSLLTATGTVYSFAPANGDAVYCKVTSNADCRAADTALSTLQTFTITPAVTPSVVVTFNHGDTLCAGTRVDATATVINKGTINYCQWYRNGNAETSSIYYNFKPDNGDVVYCKIASNASCRTADTVTSIIKTYFIPSPGTASIQTTASLPNPLCAGTEVTCSATGPFPSVNMYIWYRNKSIQSREGTCTFAPQNNDSVWCVPQIEGQACDDLKSNTLGFAVTEKTTPSVTISAVPDGTVCEGTEIALTATSTNAGTSPLYTWYSSLATGYIYNGASYRFTAKNNERIWCTVRTYNQCTTTNDAASDQKEIDVAHPPAIAITASAGPVVFRGNPVTFTAAGKENYNGDIQYQWLKNNEVIAGAINSIYTLQDIGNLDSIRCIATGLGVCAGVAASNTLAVSSYHNMALYPNPTNGDMMLSGNDYTSSSKTAMVSIFGSDGQLVYEHEYPFSGITLYADLKLNLKIAPGSYRMRISYGRSETSIPFVVRY